MSRRVARTALITALAAAAVLVTGAVAARADDPVAGTLARSSLFVPADATAPHRLLAELRRYAVYGIRHGFPVRVAVIASAYDLGPVIALWRRPQAAARFVAGRLARGGARRPVLVVMPDGFGFAWPGHSVRRADRDLRQIPITAGRTGLIKAAVRATHIVALVDILAAERQATVREDAAAAPGEHTAVIVLIVAPAATLLLGLLTLLVARLRPARPPGGDRGGSASFGGSGGSSGGSGSSGSAERDEGAGVDEERSGEGAAKRRRLPFGPTAAGLGAVCAVAVAVSVLIVARGGRPAGNRQGVTAPASRRGTPDATGRDGVTTWAAGVRRAPGFTLFSATGRPVSPAQFRGRPVIITFVDPLCRNPCPQAAGLLDEVDRALPSRARAAILAVSVDAYGDSVADLRLDDRRWRVVRHWHWAIGGPRRLAAVWRRYGIRVGVSTMRIAGTTIHFVAHDETAYVVDPRGYERARYVWPYDLRSLEREVRRVSRA